MKTAQSFNKLFEKARKRLEYFVQGAITDFTESMFARMEELDVSKMELSGRLKCRPSYISKVLRGGTNFTLESMVKIALALDSELSVKLVPKLAVEKWPEIFETLPGGAALRPSFDWARASKNMVEYTRPSQQKPQRGPNDELALAA